MPMMINTNVASLNTQRNLYKTSDMLNQAIARLSSGKRINSAADDAAGLAISERMTTQIRGLDQAVRNANDAIGLTQTAEGAMATISENLQRIRELAVQSANDSNSATDRVALNQESSALLQEIERTSTQTTFNGRTLLDGSFTAQQFQIGAQANQTVSVTVGSTRLSALGTYSVFAAPAVNTIEEAVASAALLPAANAVTAQTLTVAGSTGISNLNIAAGATAQTIAQQVNATSSTTGVTASASTTATLAALSVNAATVSIELYGANAAANPVRITAAVALNTDLSTLAQAINLKSSQTGISAVSNGANITLTSNDGYDIGVANFAVTNVAGNQTMTLTGGMATARTLTEGGTDSSRTGGRVTFNAPEGFTVTSTATTIVPAAGIAGAQTNLTTVDITTAAGANSAINVLDGALSVLNSQRAQLGATQKRVTQTISNLQNISENLSAARSRIQDTDYAMETSNLTRAQVLQQAGTAMLAQANAQPNQVLTLLRG